MRSRLNQAKQKINEYWRLADDVNEGHFYEAENWNRFYLESFGNLHVSLSARNIFLNHLRNDVKFVFTSGKTDYGRRVIAAEIEDDIRHGNSFGEINTVSSGNVSVVEAANVNSDEYPHRCPESTILVMYRSGEKVIQANLHNSPVLGFS